MVAPMQHEGVGDRRQKLEQGVDAGDVVDMGHLGRQAARLSPIHQLLRKIANEGIDFALVHRVAHVVHRAPAAVLIAIPDPGQPVAKLVQVFTPIQTLQDVELILLRLPFRAAVTLGLGPA